MKLLTNRLMTHARRRRTDGLAALIDQPASPVRIQHRIGVWPLLSEPDPETAMGLFAVLALLLEQQRDVVVYRLFVAVEDSTEDVYEWDIDQSQFSIDDWQLDELDENIAVWGELRHEPGQLTLIVEFESDLSESDEGVALEYRADSLRALLSQLSTVAADVFSQSGNLPSEKVVFTGYDGEAADDTAYAALLGDIFAWERDLFLYMWDVDWSPEQIAQQFERLVNSARAVGGELGAWLATQCALRLLNPALNDLNPVMLPLARGLADSWDDAPLVGSLIGRAFHELGETDEAVALVEKTAAEHVSSPLAWSTLVELYLAAGRMQDAVDALQATILNDTATNRLQLRYADVLLALRQSGLGLPRYVYIEAQDRQPLRVLEEAHAAYGAVLENDPDHRHALQRHILTGVELGYVDPWRDVQRLIELDTGGHYVRGLLDDLQVLDAVEPTIAALETAVQQQPDRYDLKVNLAVAYLTIEREAEALAQLELAEEMIDEPAALADVERLLLMASDPDFEFRLGEVTDLVSAGQIVSLNDIDFLEAALEDAPTFAQVYLLLAQAYRSRGDSEAVIETLLDGQKLLPDDADITELLARELWSMNEYQLALDYLNKGLAHNPDDVSLLALSGRFLFEDGQEEEARLYLARAESLNPRNRVLLEARRYIAGSVGDDR
jgi:tetratricopeptide (TPR) repeat protein